MATFKWHITVKALEHEFKSYKLEKHVQVSTISVTEYQTKLHILYKKEFLISFLTSCLYKMKTLCGFSALSKKEIQG